MLVNLLATVLLIAGILFLSSARLGLLHADQFARYHMRSPRHMKVWGWLLLGGGVAACGVAGTIFAL